MGLIQCLSQWIILRHVPDDHFPPSRASKLFCLESKQKSEPSTQRQDFHPPRR